MTLRFAVPSRLLVTVTLVLIAGLLGLLDVVINSDCGKVGL
jgi:hypothetical protein